MYILFAVLASLGFALAIIVTRIAIDKTQATNEFGSLVTLIAAGVTSLIIAVIVQADFGVSGSNLRNLVLVGLISPGTTQLSYFIAIRNIGPSRAGIFIGIAPIWSVLGAYIFTGGVINLPIIFGTIVAFIASILLGTDDSKEKFKIIGIIAGLYTGFSFGTRDVVSDSVLSTDGISSALTSGILWLAGIPLFLAYMAYKKFIQGKTEILYPAAMASIPTKQKLKNIWLLSLPGILQGAALTSLLEGFKIGRVEIVAPISNSATTTLTVIMAALILGKTEWNLKVLFSMLMIVFGAVLVGGFG